MSVILMTTLFYKKHWYYKEKFDADHRVLGLKGLRESLGGVEPAKKRAYLAKIIGSTCEK